MGAKRNEPRPRGSIVLAILFLAATLAGFQPARAQLPPNRPNILLIVSDDQTWATFNRSLMPSVYGQLVDQGALFNRAYVNSSLCCPSRSEILTGLYEHHTGVDRNNIALTRPTMVEALHGLGYRTMLAGKYLNSWPCTPRPEFDRWVCAASGGSNYQLLNPTLNVDGTWRSLTGYQTDILANYAADFIASTPADTPFFAMYTATSPHLPANDSRYSNLAVSAPRSPSFDEDTLSLQKPQYLRRFPLTSRQVTSADTNFRVMAQAVRSLDDAVATVLGALGDRTQDTLIFYLSDNGFMYGEHRRYSWKEAPYEESVRVPFAIRYPAVLAPTGAFQSDALVQNVDITPTIADVLGMHWGADGTSLLPILNGQAQSVRSAALLEHCQGARFASSPCTGLDFTANHPSVPSFSGLVTSTYKYIEYVTGEKELYDLSGDPYEIANLEGEPAYAAVESDLAAQLAALRGPPTVDTTIVSGPQGLIGARTAAFRYFSQSRFAIYECRLTKDGAPGDWHRCGDQSEVMGGLGEGDYTFEVRGIDEFGSVDATPASRSFSIRSSGPDVTIDLAPAAHTTSVSLAFGFWSQTLGATFECRLSPWGASASWEPCDDGTGISYAQLSDGLWNFEVRAIAPDSSVSDPPAAWLVRVDTRGPSPVFSERPPSSTRETNARFVFRTNEPTSDIECALDSQQISPCPDGTFTASGLAEGIHSLAVMAADELGNLATTTLSWKVDVAPPAASFTKAPSGYWRWKSPTIQLASTEPGGFECQLDGSPSMTCASSNNFGVLQEGRHTFTAMAVDPSGNVSTAATRSWIQDTVKPVVAIQGGPEASTNATTATFTLSANEPSKYICSLDGAAFAACTSPLTLPGLTNGAHTFSAEAKDRAGNLSDPATWTWTVDTST